MDQATRQTASDLRQLSSSEATAWLLDKYPVGSKDWGGALSLIEHVSLERADVFQLADHYLSRLPYASDRPYALFIKLLGVRRFLQLASKYLPASSQDRELLLYHLEPLLRDLRSDADQQAASIFFSEAGR